MNDDFDLSRGAITDRETVEQIAKAMVVSIVGTIGCALKGLISMTFAMKMVEDMADAFASQCRCSLTKDECQEAVKKVAAFKGDISFDEEFNKLLEYGGTK